MGPIVKFVAGIAAICALSETATAQTGRCRSIADPAARLACYDKAASAPAAGAATAKPAVAERPPAAAVEGGKYVDSIGDEEALVNARLRGICRGC